MNIGRSAVRMVVGVVVVAAGLLAGGATAAASVPLQPYEEVRCWWSGDGLLAQRYCDDRGPSSSGSASGSGQALGQMLGRHLFGGR